eukprot:5472293-Amphidinium_carterae.1
MIVIIIIIIIIIIIQHVQQSRSQLTPAMCRHDTSQDHIFGTELVCVWAVISLETTFFCKSQ